MKTHNHIITATEAGRSFSNILNKVHYQGDTYDIKRGKTIIAKIIPFPASQKPLCLAELCSVLDKLPALDEDCEDFANDVQKIRT